MIYFTSDTHFGHGNVIRFCDRPFSSADEMDEALITGWNARVTNGDKIYILGDLIFKHPEPESIIKRLKGEKHLIIGNHDHTWMKDVPLDKYFASVDNYAEIPIVDRWAVLSHYPMLSYRHDSKYYMIHGHIHNNCHQDFWPLLANRPLILNAGVDVNNYVPVTLPEMIANNDIYKNMNRPYHRIVIPNKTPLSCDVCPCVNHEFLCCQATKDRSVKAEYEAGARAQWCPINEI